MDLGEFRSDVRHLGMLRAGVRAAYHRVHVLTGLRLYRYLTLMPEDVNRELLARQVPYECRLLDGDEARALAHDPTNNMTVAGVARAVERGAVCFAILDGCVLASVGWYASAPTSVQKTLTVHFDSRYLYMSDGYTKPAYRGQNLHGIGLARALEAFCARGWAGLVTLAERVNFASLVSAHRVGFRDCGTAVIIGQGPRTRIWQTAAPSRYGLRLSVGVPH